ncbi:hypothetical protein GJ744_005511 [Endocarpon pusillum]|uniref:Uncharacterized protein n=1 Tax=Endocarpon pusillum TaxID=364733 RepID=A0A8H7ATP9_9EURO|nr:hypothetical protein GJ744_005511 [Endocarpon pusillum]
MENRSTHPNPSRAFPFAVQRDMICGNLTGHGEASGDLHILERRCCAESSIVPAVRIPANSVLAGQASTYGRGRGMLLNLVLYLTF